MMCMDDHTKSKIRDLYTAILEKDTVLGFDEEREIGVVSIVETRGGKTHLMPVAEIKFPLVMPTAIEE